MVATWVSAPLRINELGAKSYILLCQVISIITVTLTVLSKLNCCYNISLIHEKHYCH